MKKMVYIMLLLFLWMLLTSCAHRSVGNLFESEDKTYESIETTTVERDLYDTSESANNTTVQIRIFARSLKFTNRGCSTICTMRLTHISISWSEMCIT